MEQVNLEYTGKHNLLDTTDYNVTSYSLNYAGKHNLSDTTKYNVTNQPKIHRKT